MENKTKLIGVCFIIFGVLGLLGLPLIYIQQQVMAGLIAHAHIIGVQAQYWIEMIDQMLRILVPALVLLIVLHVLLNVLVGICFIKHKAYRSLVVASVLTCLFFPLGTLLGVFALMTLLEEDVKAKFGVSPSATRRQPER